MRSSLNQLRGAIAQFRAINPGLSAQAINTLLVVAAHEGRSLREYCELTGVTQSTMSRHLLDLGAVNRHHETGYGLIDQRPDVRDRRRNVYTLTPKGRALIASLRAGE